MTERTEQPAAANHPALAHEAPRTLRQRRLRVSFLALQAPAASPSQRYRVEAFLPALRRRGIEVSHDFVLDHDDLPIFYARGRVGRKALLAGKATLARLRSLARRRDVDAFFVQREAFFLGGAWSERLAALRAPLIYDFDDAIWIRQVSDANRSYAWLKNVEKVPHIVSLAHTVIAGNDYLAAWARQHSDLVHVVPTCVDTNHYRPPASRPAGGPVTIGWSGSPSTLAHLKPLLPVLEQVVARCRDRVRIRVMGDASFAYPPLGIVGEPWSPEAELALLREMEIGLMPLPDDEWTRGKCGFKGLLSMAMGAATVMSPVGVNREIVEHGETGFLPASDDEWIDVLCRLIADSTLRARVGAAGRQRVVDHYSVVRWGERLAGLIRAAVD